LRLSREHAPNKRQHINAVSALQIFMLIILVSAVSRQRSPVFFSSIGYRNNPDL
jgi:hypothetical protein